MLELIASFPRQSIAVAMVSHHLAAVANYVQDLVLVDRGKSQVYVGPVADILTVERLSQLYGATVVVAETQGHKSIFIDRLAPERQPAGPVQLTQVR
jgi:ABC-type hemin transport system ATPase subunit